MEKSWRPLERVQLANQIIGPLRCWRKKVKYLFTVCQILRCEESHSDFLLSLFILMSENIEERNPESGGLFWACADYLISLHPERTCNCKTSGSHLNWTILANERIIVALTMERCRLWSVGQCFNGEAYSVYIVQSKYILGTLSNRRRRPDDGNRKRDISFETSLRMYNNCDLKLRTSFSSPEAALLLVSTKNRDLWPVPATEVRDSRTSRHSAHAQSQVWQIWLALVSIYCLYKSIQN